jgi:tetraacyldisaccharide 4'-kinase
MHLKKPKFWDYKEPNIYSYILWPLSILIKIINSFKTRQKVKNYKIKTICVGNIYLGGTGKTSLVIKINEILTKKNIKSCFIKKHYENQIDEQKLLKSRGNLFSSKKRVVALNQAVENNYQVAIFDDGLQDYSINYDLHLLCFNSLNWIGNGMTIPSGPLREDLKHLKRYNHIFLNGSSENLTNIKEQILNIHPKINIHEGKYVPTNLNEFELNDEYIAFSGIGNHKTFVSMIKEFGLKVIKDIEFPDHYYYRTKDINKILEISKKLNCKIITTEKDYLRLDEKKIDEIKFVKSDLRIINENKLIEAILN